MTYIPYQHNYYRPAYTPPANYNSQPKTSVDSVRIDIINPKASAGGDASGIAPSGQNTSPYAYQQPQYYSYPPYYYPNGQNINNNYNPNINQYNTTNPAPQPVPQPQPQPQPAPQPPVQPQPQPQNQQPQNQQPQQPNEQQPKPPEKTEQKQIGNIPDSLIAAIDKGLSNPNTEVRIAAATKLLKTFEEHPESKDHPALTVLLNRVLKDPAQNVRLFGEITLKTGAANGDEETKNVLNGMTSSTKAYGQDAIMANNILFDMAGKGSGNQLDAVA